jgi:hypothetical protein
LIPLASRHASLAAKGASAMTTSGADTFMEYYHNLIAEKSFQILKELKKKYQFVLIGGWAVFLYAKALKSKDIDLIVDFDELEKLKQEFAVFKNERLKKYEIKKDETDIDIYLPFYSDLGLAAEEIKKHTQSQEGFILPIPEILLLLKIYTSEQRKGSVKGQKDILDIFSLLKEDLIDWPKYKKLIDEYKLKPINDSFKSLVKLTGPLPELNLNQQAISKLKKKILAKIS